MWKRLKKLLGHCEHKWEEIERTHTAPIPPTATILFHMSITARSDALSGYTNILFLCRNCQELKQIEMPGVCAKTKETGRYSIAKYANDRNRN
jgi:hypothetical protein